MPLTVEASYTLVNALQTATGELNIQARMLGGVAYRRNSVVIHMRVLKEHQDLVTQKEKDRLTCKGIRDTNEKEQYLSCRHGSPENPGSLATPSRPRSQTPPSLFR